MEDLLDMTGGDGLAHLGKHGGNQTETGTRKELCRVEGGEEGRGWGRVVVGVIIWDWVVMIAGLGKKIEEVLAGDVFEDEEEIRVGLQRPM